MTHYIDSTALQYDHPAGCKHGRCTTELVLTWPDLVKALSELWVHHKRQPAVCGPPARLPVQRTDHHPVCATHLYELPQAVAPLEYCARPKAQAEALDAVPFLAEEPAPRLSFQK
ncbi:hypothetical protein BJ912DRAFT_1069563 [Pholiota molesta]|nr:hypothetical protein BJ912DRAFT_1069563 [Pholiota molesta]